MQKCNKIVVKRLTTKVLIIRILNNLFTNNKKNGNK